MWTRLWGALSGRMTPRRELTGFVTRLTSSAPCHPHRIHRLEAPAIKDPDHLPPLFQSALADRPAPARPYARLPASRLGLELESVPHLSFPLLLAKELPVGSRGAARAARKQGRRSAWVEARTATRARSRRGRANLRRRRGSWGAPLSCERGGGGAYSSAQGTPGCPRGSQGFDIVCGRSSGCKQWCTLACELGARTILRSAAEPVHTWQAHTHDLGCSGLSTCQGHSGGSSSVASRTICCSLSSCHARESTQAGRLLASVAMRHFELFVP